MAYYYSLSDLVDFSQFFEIDEKLKRAEWFYNQYKNFSIQDIYSWLWLGEFGYHEFPDNDLSSLKQEIWKAKLNPSSIRKVWEPLGISQKFVKINIDIFFDLGYPLKRLIDLVNKMKEYTTMDKLGFRSAWNLMKVQLDIMKKVTITDFQVFQENVPFFILPYYPFTEEFEKEFGKYYRIVPLEDFFRFYPELTDIYEEIYIDIKAYTSEL